jgi:signal transduction histidine kinase/CheY-like chemotaxis protein
MDGRVSLLEQDLADARAQLAATDQVLLAVGRSASDLDSILDTVVASVCRLCRADVGQIHLVDRDRFRLAAARGHTEEYQEFVAHHEIALDRNTLIGRVGLDRRAQQIEDVLADPDYGRADLQEIAGFRTILGGPMLFDGELIGVVSAWRTEVAPFGDRAAEVLTHFAAQAAIAIRNVQLVRALEARQDELALKVDQLEALGEIGQAVSASLDPQAVLEAIIGHAAELSAADGGSIFEFDERAEAFLFRAGFGTSAEVREALGKARIGLHDTLLGAAALAREPQQVEDLLDHGPLDPHLEVLLDSGWRSLIAVPIVHDEHILGALTLRNRTPRRFSGEAADLLQAFAGQSALAVMNARLFRELERKGVELEIASRHKSEFLASMSHELRTPLNAVIGFSEVLLERMFGDLNERQEEYLRDIWESGRHLLELLNEILDLSKVEAGKMELEPTPVDVHAVLAEGITMVRELAASRGARLDLDVGEGVDTVTADLLRFKQVVLNLLSNAVKFAHHRIVVRARVDGSMLVVSVEDDGDGVPPADQERIFEAFQQGGRGVTKEQGTGLGLTLCRRIVELHGGQIWVESEVGRGSTFTFAVPTTPSVEPQPWISELEVRAPDVPIVVIVEDDRRSLELLTLYLQGAGAEVVTARDGQAGLELVRRVQPAAIVLDIGLPKIDGWDLLALFKADPATANIPVVVVSMIDERAKGLALGASEYLVKPVERSAVRAALKRVVPV